MTRGILEEYDDNGWGAHSTLRRLVDMADADADRVMNGDTLRIPRPQVVTSPAQTRPPSPFPLDAARSRRNPEAYHAVYRLLHRKNQARDLRAGMVFEAQQLHRRVDAERSR